MLRLRSLKRGLAIQERHRSSAKTPNLNRVEPGSVVLHLRYDQEPVFLTRSQVQILAIIFSYPLSQRKIPCKRSKRRR